MGNENIAAVGGTVIGASLPVSSPTRTFTMATGTAASSGDNTLIAAPGAGVRLVIKELMVQNESATDTTAIIKFAATAKWRALLSGSNKGAIAFDFADGDEWRLGANEALVLNLSAANSHGYSVRYRTETL